MHGRSKWWRVVNQFYWSSHEFVANSRVDSILQELGSRPYIEEVPTENTFAAKVERRLAEMQNAGLGDQDSRRRMLEQESREVEHGIERLLSAIEKGAPYDLCAAKLQALAGRKTNIDQRRQELLDKGDEEAKSESLISSCYVKSQVSSWAFYEPDNRRTTRITDHAVISRQIPANAGIATRWWFGVENVGRSLWEAESGNAKTCKLEIVLSHKEQRSGISAISLVTTM